MTILHNPDNEWLRQSSHRCAPKLHTTVLSRRRFHCVFPPKTTRFRLFNHCSGSVHWDSGHQQLQVLLYKGLGLTGSIPLPSYAVYLSKVAFLNWVSAIIMDSVGRVRPIA